MAGPGGAAQRRERKSGWFGWLLTGIVLGVLGAVFLPDLAAPYLPNALRGDDTEVAGVVQSTSAESDRFLVTVGSRAGATLVTFTKDVDRFEQFIGVGDSVVLAVSEYAPFIDDPRIRRVMKAGDWRAVSADRIGPGDPDAPRAGDTAGGMMDDTGDATDPAETVETMDTTDTTDSTDTTEAAEAAPPASGP